ncbi:MAG: hypothetical protein WKF43_00845 [Acidimicrobiales bacterium]
MLRFQLQGTGFSSQGARLLPFALGVAIGPVFALVALRMRQRLVPAVPAVLGAALLVAAPTLASYSVRVKQYTLEVVLVTVSVGLGWATVRRAASARLWWGLAACSIAPGSCPFRWPVWRLSALAAGGLLVEAGLAASGALRGRGCGRRPAPPWTRGDRPLYLGHPSRMLAGPRSCCCSSAHPNRARRASAGGRHEAVDRANGGVGGTW